MTIIFPDMAVSAEEFSLYEQAMEDAIISLLVWQNLSTLYYSRKWTEERSYLPIGESLSRAGCFLYEKDIEDDRSKIATTLIDAYDGHLPKIIDPEDPGHLRILEKFVNPEDPYDTPECFLLLCTRKLALSKNNPTLRDATLCELWDGVCDDIRGTAPLFINWIYNYYSPSTPSSPSDPAAEIKSDDTDQRPLLLDIFDHTFYLALYRALEDCADSILKIPRRGSSQDPNPAERLWTRNLSSIAMSFYKEKEYEKAAALYAFIEIFSQDKFLYSHLAALARIFRFQAGNDPEATRCFEEAIKRGYPCHTPLARYLTEQGIKVKAEDDSSCCACCIMS
ncbi:MAG: hypothetical protein QG632_401 [Candidatus Dependentiae bacterium]|nr:hypothetical protein [Candidatus Dependentiae bacterium]